MKIETKCDSCGLPIKRYRSKSGMHYCGIECKSAWQKNKRESLGFTEEWLKTEYFSLGKSANQIAREIGRDPKRVWEWMRDYSMDIRPRGSDYGNTFKPGCGSAFKGKKHTEETKNLIRDARLKDGRVPYLKDGKHWLKQDGAKPASWRGGVTPERQAFYSSDSWADAVKSVWVRDNATCQRCGKHHNTAKARGTFHIHHVVSFRVKRLRAETSNLVLLCRQCHLWVHSRENSERTFIKDQDNEL